MTLSAWPARLLAAVLWLPMAGAALAQPVDRALTVAAVGPSGPEMRCTATRDFCIGLESYIPDICRAIEDLAVRNRIDPGFFARLLWKESLFDASAVSPAGAEGIAQFMPGTAALRGLDDPFNPAKALSASAAYLAELRDRFGNLGLAAVAYNGGENRAARFVAGGSGLPYETQDYVQAITGHSAETWRDDPPDTVDLSLEAGVAFQPACVTRAAARTLREFHTPQLILPWGVMLASHSSRDVAQRSAARVLQRFGAVLGAQPVVYTRTRIPGMAGRRHVAQIGHDTRSDANKLCARLRGAGGSCIVLRN